MLFTSAESAREYALRHEQNPELVLRFIEQGGFSGGAPLLQALFADSKKAPALLAFEIAALFEYGYAATGVATVLAGWRNAGPSLREVVPTAEEKDWKGAARQALRRAARNRDGTPLRVDIETSTLLLDFMFDVCHYAQAENPAHPVPVASAAALEASTEFFTNILSELNTHNAKIAHSFAPFATNKMHTPSAAVFLSGLAFSPVLGGKSSGGEARKAPLFIDYSTAQLEVMGIPFDISTALTDEELRRALHAAGVVAVARMPLLTPLEPQLNNWMLPRVKFPAGAQTVELNLVPSNAMVVQMSALAERVGTLSAQARKSDENVWIRYVPLVATVGSNPNNVGTVYARYAKNGLPRFAATNQSRLRLNSPHLRRLHTVELHLSKKLASLKATTSEGRDEGPSSPLTRHQLSGKWLPRRVRAAIGEGLGRKMAFEVARQLRRMRARFATSSGPEREACLAAAITPLQRFVLRAHTEEDLETLAAQCTRVLDTAREDVITAFTSALIKNLELCA